MTTRQKTGGRKLGTKNKIQREVKEMILEALDKAGGVDYLVTRALEEKTAGAFLALVGKVLPLQVTGAGGGPVVHAQMSTAEFEQIARNITSEI